MNDMKYFRRKSRVAGVSTVLSVAMLLNAILTLPVMALARGAGEASIDPRTGSVNFKEVRLSVPCPGIDLEFNLKYQSLTGQLEGKMGQGWHHNYEWSLDLQSTEAILYTDMGREIIFPKVGSEYGTPDRSNWELLVVSGGYKANLPGGMSYHFGMDGRLVGVKDAWGNQVTCAYNTNNCLTMAVHSNGRFLSFHNEWNAGSSEWRVASAWALYGAGVEFEYNSDGQFTQVVERVGANSYTSSYHYADGFLTNRVDSAGFESSFTYEAGSNGKGTHLDVDGFYVCDVEYLSSSQTDMTYHRNGKDQVYRHELDSSTGELLHKYGPSETVSVVAVRGKHYEYAPNGTDKTKITQFDGTTNEDWVETMDYDDTHNMTNYAVTYGAGSPVQQFAYEYDPVWQLPTVIEDAEGQHLKTIVYSNGSPTVVKTFYTETNSYDSCYSYTVNGLLQARTNANNHVVGYNHDVVGNLISINPEVGPIITNTFDNLGFTQTLEILSEDGTSTGRIKQFERNKKGQITQFLYPDGATKFYARNALGWITNVVDRAGRNTDYTYAPDKRITSRTQYLKKNGTHIPVRTGYDLDEQANVLRISEPRGRYVESYQRDIQDRVTAITNIETQVMSIDYGVGDFANQITRFDGSTLTNTYDTAGRKSTVTYSGETVLTYDYYADGQLKAIADSTSSITNSYDALNRLTNQIVQTGNRQSKIGNAFDSVDNLTNSVISIGGVQASATASTFDAAERLKTRGNHIFEYSLTNGKLASVSNTLSGLTTAYGYDLMDRTTSITHRTTGGVLIRSIEYAYDVASMITEKKIVDTASSFVSHTYEYDTLNRLVSEEQSNSVSSVYSVIKYSYDLAGNRLTKTVDGLGSAYVLGDGNRLASTETIYTIDFQGTASEAIGTNNQWGTLWVSNTTANTGWIPQVDGANFWVDDLPLDPGTNQLIAAIRDAAGNIGFSTNSVILDTPALTTQHQYDAAGCLTNLNGTALEWDERYRLTSATSASSAVAYAYDALNRRISSIEGSITNHFVYNGNHVAADLDGSGSLLRTYVWGQGIDNLLSFTDHTTSNTYYAIKDHQNTVIALTDSSGTIVERYEYSAYGKIMDVKDGTGNSIANQKSAIGNRYTFQGREIDWITGLYYFRARWYNPETSRWLSKDPIGIHGGLNQYVAFGNNPVIFIDPTGESPGIVIIVVIVVYGVFTLIRVIYRGGKMMDRSREKGNEANDLIERMENGEDVSEELNEVNEEIEEILNETEELALDMIEERINNVGF